jgi:hypothetical protein
MKLSSLGGCVFFHNLNRLDSNRFTCSGMTEYAMQLTAYAREANKADLGRHGRRLVHTMKRNNYRKLAFERQPPTYSKSIS